jgi:pentatricopeptide repeat protein
MIISYNCALDIYANILDLEGAISLFEEIESNFKADLISYSTIIKALCNGNKKDLALEYLKKMIKSKIEIDVSVINLFLESCSTKEDFKYSLEGYKFAMM